MHPLTLLHRWLHVASVGSVGDSYGNAMAEPLIRQYGAEAIHRLGPWGGQEGVEYTTLDWVQRCCKERLHGELDYLSPSGYEEQYCQTRSESAVAA